MAKVSRVLKIFKIKSKLEKHLPELLKLNEGIIRFISLLISYLILQHVTACLW